MSSSAPDVFRRQVVQAFMVSPCVVVSNEVPDLPLKIFGQIIVFQTDAVFKGAVPALDLALRHRVIGLSACMIHAVTG